MKTDKLIKIFVINTIFVVLTAKILPLFFINLSERKVERILLLYFLIFNIALLVKLLHNKKEEG